MTVFLNNNNNNNNNYYYYYYYYYVFFVVFKFLISHQMNHFKTIQQKLAACGITRIQSLSTNYFT